MKKDDLSSTEEETLFITSKKVAKATLRWRSVLWLVLCFGRTTVSVAFVVVLLLFWQ